MKIIKWCTDGGYTIILAPSEVPRVEKALEDAKRQGHGEGKDFEIDVSPILGEETGTKEGL